MNGAPSTLQSMWTFFICHILVRRSKAGRWQYLLNNKRRKREKKLKKNNKKIYAYNINWNQYKDSKRTWNTANHLAIASSLSSSSGDDGTNQAHKCLRYTPPNQQQCNVKAGSGLRRGKKADYLNSNAALWNYVNWAEVWPRWSGFKMRSY